MKSIFKIFAVIGIFYIFFKLYFGHQSPYYIKLAHQITAQTAKKLEKSHKLVLVGTGGQMMHDIQMMMMGFNYYQVVDIPNARQLLVDAVESYLTAINSNEKVRPYLHTYPFTAKNIEISIYFYQPNGNSAPLGQLSIAAANEGKVTYFTHDLNSHRLKEIQEETYQEAFNLAHLR